MIGDIDGSKLREGKSHNLRRDPRKIKKNVYIRVWRGVEYPTWAGIKYTSKDVSYNRPVHVKV